MEGKVRRNFDKTSVPTLIGGSVYRNYLTRL
jgi:hypothetical protein